METADLAVAGLFLASTLRLAAPLLLAAMGELVSERAGVLNLSVEGMLLVGAFFGAWGAHAADSAWWGLAAAVAAALTMGGLQAALSVHARADQIVVGLGLNLLALGLTTLLSRLVFGVRAQTQVPGFGTLQVSGLSDSPVLGALLEQNLLVYAAAAAVLLTWLLLRHSGLGLALWAAGENPQAADQTGVPVRRVRVLAVLYTSAMCGLGGAFFSLGDIRTFVEGMSGGAGFIALVAVIFGNWRVLPVAGACLLFGAMTALRFLLPAMQVDVPLALLSALPYLAALLAMAGVVGRQTPPAALAVPYSAQRDQ